MRSIDCNVLRIKALYKCCSFTIWGYFSTLVRHVEAYITVGSGSLFADVLLARRVNAGTGQPFPFVSIVGALELWDVTVSGIEMVSGRDGWLVIDVTLRKGFFSIIFIYLHFLRALDYSLGATYPSGFYKGHREDSNFISSKWRKGDTKVLLVHLR